MQLSRRRLIRTGGVCSVLALSGCAAFGGDDGDLVVENTDEHGQYVTAIMDQGSSYPPRLESADLDPESTTPSPVTTNSPTPIPNIT